MLRILPFSRAVFTPLLVSAKSGRSPSTKHAINTFMNLTILQRTTYLPKSPFSAPSTALKIGLVKRTVNICSFCKTRSIAMASSTADREGGSMISSCNRDATCFRSPKSTKLTGFFDSAQVASRFLIFKKLFWFSEQSQFILDGVYTPCSVLLLECILFNIVPCLKWNTLSKKFIIYFINTSVISLSV